jgi:hypothetical protein
MKYFEEEKKQLERVAVIIKEYVALRKKLLCLKRPIDTSNMEEMTRHHNDGEDLHHKIKKLDQELSDLSDKLTPPKNWLDTLLGRAGAHWVRWRSKAKGKIKELPKEEREEAKKEYESLMPLHNEIEKYASQIEPGEVNEYWRKEIEWVKGVMDNNDRQKTKNNKRVKEIEAEQKVLIEELRCRGNNELADQLLKEEAEAKAKLKNKV